MVLLSVCQLQLDVARATINAGTTIVPSIGHSFLPENPDPMFGHPAYVIDFLVNQTQEVGGGAILPSVTVNLDLDRSISYKIAAPAGFKFVIHVPTGKSAVMYPDLDWRTPESDSGSSAGFVASFQNLVGVPPSFPNNSAVGVNNQFFDFTSASPSFSNDLSFTAVKFTTIYTPRTLGLGPLTYQPTGSTQPFGTTSANANFTASYTTTGMVDPGRFVSLEPFALGDYNQNGVVDAADYTVWRDTLGQTGIGLAADGNQDGIVDQLDFQFWKEHFPGQSGAGARANAVVPEPSTLVLLMLAATGWRLWRGWVAQKFPTTC